MSTVYFLTILGQFLRALVFKALTALFVLTVFVSLNPAYAEVDEDIAPAEVDTGVTVDTPESQRWEVLVEYDELIEKIDTSTDPYFFSTPEYATIAARVLELKKQIKEKKMGYLRALRTAYYGFMKANEDWLRERIPCLDKTNQFDFMRQNYELCAPLIWGHHNGKTGEESRMDRGIDDIVMAYQEMRIYAALSRPRFRSDQYAVIRRESEIHHRMNPRPSHHFEFFAADYEDAPRIPDLPPLTPHEVDMANGLFSHALMIKEAEFWQKVGIDLEQREIDLEEQFAEVRAPLMEEYEAWKAQALEAAGLEYLEGDLQEESARKLAAIERKVEDAKRIERLQFDWEWKHRLGNYVRGQLHEVHEKFKEKYFNLLNKYPVLALMDVPMDPENEDSLYDEFNSRFPSDQQERFSFFAGMYPNVMSGFSKYISMSNELRNELQFGDDSSDYDTMLPLIAFDPLVAEILDPEKNDEVVIELLDQMKAEFASDELWSELGYAGLAVAGAISCVALVGRLGPASKMLRWLFLRVLSARAAATLTCGFATGLPVNYWFLNRAQNKYLDEYKKFFSSSGVGPKDGLKVLMDISRLDQKSSDLMLELIMLPIGMGVYPIAARAIVPAVKQRAWVKSYNLIRRYYRRNPVPWRLYMERVTEYGRILGFI